MPLSPVMRKFILHWGEMGARWGVNRTVAQVHALLYLSPRPLTAEEITATLSVARSNVSSSLRELLGWGIVRQSLVLGDRRDHFESTRDVWEMLKVIMEQRKRREVDPTLALLRECVAELDGAPPADPQTRKRLMDLLELFETAEHAYSEARSMSIAQLRNVLKLRGGLRKLLRLAAS